MKLPIHKPHVLLLSFIFSPNIGGVESHLDDLCGELMKRGYKITVITYQPLLAKVNAAAFEKKDNFEIHRISWLKFNLFNRLEKFPVLQMMYLIPAIFIYSSFYVIKNYKRVDIIQTHGFNMAIVGFLISSLFHKPFTVNTHVSFYFQKSSLYAKSLKFVLNRAQAVLVLTKEAQNELIKIGVTKEKVKVYHQWIDTKLFVPKDRNKGRTAYQLSQNSFVALFTGRLVPAKGLLVIIEAAKRVKKNIQFVIVGSGPLKDQLVITQKENPSVRFIGQVEREELPILYSLADVCIFPSIQATSTYAEGIPRVMIEALSCGTPLIVTKTGGVAEVITTDVGYFIEPTADSVVRILATLVNKKSALHTMRKECIAYAKEKFDKDINVKIIEESFL